MNQIIPVGNGFLIAVEHQMPMDEFGRFMEVWRERFPGVPLACIPQSRYVQRVDGPDVFEFMGQEVTQEVVDGFREWWVERAGRSDAAVSHAGTIEAPAKGS